MTDDDVRVFTPRNRLAKVLVFEGGPTREEAVTAAEDELDRLAPRISRSVDQQVILILDIYSQGVTAIQAQMSVLGDASLKIAEIAGAGYRPDIGEVARGIRAMSEAYATSGTWHADALNLHFATLALLSTKDAPDPKPVRLLLERLSAMRAAVGVED